LGLGRLGFAKETRPTAIHQHEGSGHTVDVSSGSRLGSCGRASEVKVGDEAVWVGRETEHVKGMVPFVANLVRACAHGSTNDPLVFSQFGRVRFGAATCPDVNILMLNFMVQKTFNAILSTESRKGVSRVKGVN
jgi:hypothetical protein